MSDGVEKNQAEKDAAPRLPGTKGEKAAKAPKAPIDNSRGYLTASPLQLAEAYRDFKILEDLKAAVADGFPPEVAMAIEATDQGRPEFIGYLRGVLDSLAEVAAKQERPPLRTAAEVAEDRYANVTGKDLASTLRTEVMFQRERVENPAIPLDAGAIIDFPKEFAYKWVPAPPKHRAFTPDESANLEGMVRKGWRFYSPDLLKQSPNMRGLPWKLGWDAEGDKVRWQDQWLMFRFRDLEIQDRLNAIARSNAKGKREEGRRTAKDARGDEYAYVVHSTGGDSTVDRVLREKPDALDAVDQEFPGL